MKKSPPNKISSLLNKTNESIYPTPPAYSNFSVSKLPDKYQTNKIQHKISKASTNSSTDITDTNQTSNFNKRINEINKKVKNTEVDSIKDLLTFMDRLY